MESGRKISVWKYPLRSMVVVYPDEDDIINKGVTDRLAVDEIVTWHGI